MTRSLRRASLGVLLATLQACTPAAPSQPDAEVLADAAADGEARDVVRPMTDVIVPLPDVAETPLPDFALQDQNSASASSGMSVSLSAQRGRISAWYFATSACQFCVSQVAQLQRLQTELDAAAPRRPVRLFVIADLDSDGSTSAFTMGNSLPVLQDNRASNVQRSWMAAIRDVVVVDDEGTRKIVYNLTTRPLSDSTYFNDLKARLLALANR